MIERASEDFGNLVSDSPPFAQTSIQEQHSALISTSFKHMDGRGRVLELIHGILGLSGEVGELTDAVKKHWAYSKDLDLVNVIEELGDIEYYLEAVRQNLSVCYGYDMSRESILQGNLTKLRKRYPGEVFTNAAAVARADKLDEELTKVRNLPQLKAFAESGTPEWHEMQETRMREQESKKGGAL